MKIVIIGGTGLIGSKLTNKLRLLGQEVVVAVPETGVNTITGDGLTETLRGTDVVVDVANSPSFDDNAVLAFFEASGHNLLAAGKLAGVKHHIALSVVGTDRLQESGYFRAKQAQENLIKESGIPFTIVHSTQFFEFLPSIIAAGAKGEQIHMSPAETQPISSDDVASFMADIALLKPANTIIEIAGPELFSLPELVLRYLDKIRDPRRVKLDARARYFGAKLQNRTLVPWDDARLGSMTFESWFNSRTKTNVLV